MLRNRYGRLNNSKFITSNFTRDHNAYYWDDLQREKTDPPEGIEGLQALVMNFTLPISLFYTFYRASIKADTVIFPVTFFVVTAGGSFAGRLLCKLVKEKIAEKYNTTPEEVRREMQIAIDAGFDNPDPAVQEVFMGNLNPVIRKVNRM